MISLGLRTLFVKEVRRFLRVPGQTLLSPLITTTLYLAVFGWSLGGRLRDVDGIPYARFIVPGLVALGVISNSYLNTASSLFVMKIQGTIVDLLIAPLSYGEILTGLLSTAAPTKPARISPYESGDTSRSTTVPWIFMTKIEDAVLRYAFETTPSATRPGTM